MSSANPGIETNDDAFIRLSDKYHGQKLCDMSQVDLSEFLGAVARRGAVDALKAMGLNDEYAVQDIRDLRDMLKGFRVVRKNAVRTFLAGIGRIFGWAILLWVAGYVVAHNPQTKEIIKMIAE